MFTRQKQELERSRVCRVGESGLKGFSRGASTRRVAVKAEHDVVGETEKFMDVLWGAGCAQCCNGISKTHLRERNNVHVPLCNQRIAPLAHRRATLEQAVKLTSFREQ